MLFSQDKFGSLQEIPCLGPSAFHLTEKKRETEIDKD